MRESVIKCFASLIAPIVIQPAYGVNFGAVGLLITPVLAC